MIKVFTDGGSRGNPGPAAIGVFAQNDKGEKLYELGKKIGETTNNVAEYSAVIAGLEWVSANFPGEEVSFYMDSELLCRQLNGIYKIKNANLAKLMIIIRSKESKITNRVKYHHIPRELNKKADSMVNAALDNLI